MAEFFHDGTCLVFKYVHNMVTVDISEYITPYCPDYSLCCTEALYIKVSTSRLVEAV